MFCECMKHQKNEINEDILLLIEAVSKDRSDPNLIPTLLASIHDIFQQVELGNDAVKIRALSCLDTLFGDEVDYPQVQTILLDNKEVD